MKQAPEESARCQLGWWTEMTTSDVRLFMDWLEVHGAVVISAQSIERYASFFDALPRRKIITEDHPVGFIFRKKGRSS